MVEAWVCDLCGHVWLPGKSYPKQCAKCRTRIWNCDGVVESKTVAPVVLESRVPAVAPVVESKPKPKAEPKATERPRSTAEKCPHGYQNYLVCRRLNGGC